jgi:hypothetical protein
LVYDAAVKIGTVFTAGTQKGLIKL